VVEGSYHLSLSWGGQSYQLMSAWVLPVWNVVSWSVVRCIVHIIKNELQFQNINKWYEHIERMEENYVVR
jgi:hypothetical protein